MCIGFHNFVLSLRGANGHFDRNEWSVYTNLDIGVQAGGFLIQKAQDLMTTTQMNCGTDKKVQVIRSTGEFV